MADDEWAPDWASDTSGSDVDPDLPPLEPPPCDDLHGTVDDVVKSLQAFARPHGYAISIARSKPHKPRRPGVPVGVLYLQCSKGGKFTPSIAIKRKRGKSRMTECPFSMVAREDRGVWTLYIRCKDHNHGPIQAHAHASHKKLAMTAEKKERIKHASRNGAKPRQLLNEFRDEDPDCILDIRNIYNAKAELRSEALKNLTPTQALAVLLEEREDWFYVIDKDPESHKLRRLFFAHLPTARELLAANYEVLILDCTYKTNRYKMPLLDIVGHTCLGTTYVVALCFLSGETQEDFEWALKHGIRKLYRLLHLPSPNVLVTDRDTALIKAIEVVYSLTSVILCV